MKSAAMFANIYLVQSALRCFAMGDFELEDTKMCLWRGLHFMDNLTSHISKVRAQLFFCDRLEGLA